MGEGVGRMPPPPQENWTKMMQFGAFLRVLNSKWHNA